MNELNDQMTMNKDINEYIKDLISCEPIKRHINEHLNESVEASDDEHVDRHLNGYASNDQSTAVGCDLERRTDTRNSQVDFCDLCSYSNAAQSNESIESDRRTSFANRRPFVSNQSVYLDETNYVDEPNYEPNYVDETNYLVNYRDPVNYVDELASDHFNDFGTFFEEQSKSLNQEMTELETELFDYHEYEYENGDDYQHENRFDNEMLLANQPTVLHAIQHENIQKFIRQQNAEQMNQTDSDADNEVDNYLTSQQSRLVDRFRINKNDNHQNLINHHHRNLNSNNRHQSTSDEAAFLDDDCVQPQLDLITKDFEKVNCFFFFFLI